MSYTIMSFNVRKMGESAIEQRRKDWRLIARMVHEYQADLVSMQEVFSEMPVQELCRNLRMYGGNWDYRFELKETVRNGTREGYAFLWNTGTMSLLVINGKTYEPHIEAKWSRSLIRPPYVGRFIPIASGSPFIEIRLINTHIIFAKDKYSESKGISISDLQMRKNEYRKLSKEVFPMVAHERNGIFRVGYTFITGDYNMSLSDCFKIDSEITKDRISMTSDQKDKTTLSRNRAMGIGTDAVEQTAGVPKGQIPSMDYYVHDYDHFSFSDHESDYVVSARRIDAPREFCACDFKYYLENISDHVPVYFKLELRHY